MLSKAAEYLRKFCPDNENGEVVQRPQGQQKKRSVADVRLPGPAFCPEILQVSVAQLRNAPRGFDMPVCWEDFAPLWPTTVQVKKTATAVVEQGALYDMIC